MFARLASGAVARSLHPARASLADFLPSRGPPSWTNQPDEAQRPRGVARCRTHGLPCTVLLGIWPGNSSLLATRRRPGIYPGVIVSLGCDGYVMPSTKAGARSSSSAIWSTAVWHTGRLEIRHGPGIE